MMAADSDWRRAFRSPGLFMAVALAVSVGVTFALIARPGFTDAFYHFNAARRLVTGQGFTDLYLWTYVGAPADLPAPSHLYWMPMTSVLAAAGMLLAGNASSYAAAQWPFALLFALVGGIGYALGARLGGTRRHAWLAGLLTLFSGYYTRFWGATDTFAPYALFGALGLVAFGLAASSPRRASRLRWLAAAGALSGLAHLTRADGVLLLLVGLLIAVWPGPSRRSLDRIAGAVALALPYALVMLPWFLRNLAVVGAPLPAGGLQAVWFTAYDDLFSYPADATPATFFAGGIARVVGTRWEAAVNNLGTFIAVEGLIVLTPLMLVGLWRRRRDPFLRGFWLYALGLHALMTLVFPFPGYRGGLLHSAAALVPWWAALGAVGLDDVLDWLARRRRWRRSSARVVFSVALVAFAVMFSLNIGWRGRVAADTPALYLALARALPPDARVMINDPAQLYYFTGLGGVVLPNEAPAVIRDIARQYGVGYLLLEGPAATPRPLWTLYDDPPDFLTPLSLDVPGYHLYAIQP